MIVDINYYTLYQGFLPTTGWLYTAVWQGLSQKQQTLSGCANNSEILDGLVLMLTPPLKSGEVVSRLVTAAADIQDMIGTKESINYTIYWLAHPVYPLELHPRDTKDEITSPPFATVPQLMTNQSALPVPRGQRIISATPNRKHHADLYGDKKAAYNTYLEYLETHRLAHSRRQTHVERQAMFGEAANRRHADNPPYMNDLPITTGDTLGKAPTPALPPGALDHMANVMRQVYLLLGVAPQLVGLEYRNHAANPEIAFSVFNDNIRNRQNELEPMLKEIFEFIYSDQLGDATVEFQEPPGLALAETQHAKGAPAKKKAPKKTYIHAHLRGRPITSSEQNMNLFTSGVIDVHEYKRLQLGTTGVHPSCATDEVLTREEVVALTLGHSDFGPQPPNATTTKRKKSSS